MLPSDKGFARVLSMHCTACRADVSGPFCSELCGLLLAVRDLLLVGRIAVLLCTMLVAVYSVAARTSRSAIGALYTSNWLNMCKFACQAAQSSASWRLPPGGETMILQPHLLGSFWQTFQPNKGQELADLIQLVEPKCNQLTVFDPRLPHGVRPLHGTRDPQQGRLVLHGEQAAWQCVDMRLHLITMNVEAC
eukprot:GHRR01036234.1.p1 GENE.GHRR01036234.1~~GHRR01036234.1.p1  ORF type:complete len:192 (-),score=34.04 GHRR01036234.1:64-639(-)